MSATRTVAEAPVYEALSRAEADEALRRELAELGMTDEQLAAEAAAGDFSSSRARRLWVISGGSLRS